MVQIVEVIVFIEVLVMVDNSSKSDGRRDSSSKLKLLLWHLL